VAIEKDLGSGGLPEDINLPSPELEQAEIDVIEFNKKPNVTEFDDGSAIVGEFTEETEVQVEIPFDGNLAQVIDEAELGRISNDLTGSVQDDMSSREEWEGTYKKGLELLGMKYEERSQPFEGATGVIHPLLGEAVTQFQAQAYREMLPASGPVRTQVIGENNSETTQQAERVKNYMNYQITHEMEEYDPELDQMLFYLPVVGSTFKKVYFDPILQRAVSKFIHAEDLVVPYTATDLLTSPRITHIIKMDSNEVRKLQLAGFYKNIDLPSSGYGDAEYSQVEETINEIEGVYPTKGSEELTIYEIHTDLDIEGYEDMGEDGEPSGLKLPYVVTILEENGEILAIRRNYEEQDMFRKKKPYFVHYKFMPGLGFYGLGLTHMIGGLAQASTSILRQLIDSGTLSNLPAGFKARGARIRDEDTALQPGEFRDIDVAGGDIRTSLMSLPFKEPSGTLYNLLGTLVDAGRRFASMADMKIGEMGGETPVGTTMAIMERGTKVMSAIHKRLHYSQKTEFKLLANIFAQNPSPYPYNLGNVNPAIKVQDFDARIDILPVSDPNIFSMSQRVTLAQTELQLVQSNPQIHGGPQGLYKAYRNMYEALGVSNIDAILPPPTEPQPTNPAKENQNAMMGQSLQAFIGQDHQAHIQSHLAVLATPTVQTSMPVAAVLQGHIQEHIGMLAEQKAQEEVLSQIPPEQQMMLQQDPNMQQQIQIQIQNLAAQLISEMIEQYAEAVTPSQPQQDPLVSIRQQELALKGADIQRKKEEFDKKLELDQQEAMNDTMTAQQRVDIAQQALNDKTRIAEERIQTQRDIATLNFNKRN
tara:strand:+ start:3555 stop:6005 length:2451 start_codon:yes stop_codon:yes gene_type:complete